MGITPFNAYLEQEVFSRYPVLKTRAKSDPNMWELFFSKYAFMVKDELYNALRNSTRQKRYFKRYFANLKTVLAEACNADCMYNGTDRPTGNPALEPCELMTVSMGLDAAVRNLNLAFKLQLVRVEELPMFALNYVCLFKPAQEQFENILFGHVVDDMVKKGLVDTKNLT
jgi:hypothetical protein